MYPADMRPSPRMAECNCGSGTPGAVARLGVVEGEVQRQASVGAAQQETLQARLAKLEVPLCDRISELLLVEA